MNDLKEAAAMEKTKNVLVCDDDPVQLKILTSLLNRAGYRSLAALSPAEAVMKARQCGVDAVLTDVVLPDKNGFELVSDLRRMGFDAPVFMTSAHATEGMRTRARKAGVNWFFEKPFALRAIKERVDAALRMSTKPDTTVLILEDLPKVRARLEKSVAEAGFGAIAVADGRKALEILASAQGRLDLLLMDLDANDSSGAALIQKALSLVPSLHVVMMSDEADRDEIRAGYEAGASSLIRKSIPSERLQAFLKGTLQGVLAGRKDREESRRRGERLAAEPFHLKAIRWIKSYLHAPSHTRKAARASTLALAILGMAIGVGSAVGLQHGYDQADRAEALAERLARRMLASPEPGLTREEKAIGRFQAEEQLGLMREANTFTRRYYEGHLEEMRRQVSPKSPSEQVLTAPGRTPPMVELMLPSGR
jgi:DNA-binding response OmpR family regulator